jgi:DNA-binding winged helix-turn-helix (wHTH) protein
MLTARGDEADRVVGLEMGADDYVVKPFSPKELLARVRALFRRLERKDEGDDVTTIGVVEVDRPRHLVRCAGKDVRLTAKEFALLLALIDARGRVLSRDALLQDVWGYSYTEGTRTVDVHVRRLREKMPAFAASIVTVKSLGYRIPRGRRMTRFGAARAHRAGRGGRRPPPPSSPCSCSWSPACVSARCAHTRTTLLAEARLMARVVERPLAEATPPSEIDALVDSAAREVSARVTIIAPDGRVLADSSLSGPELAAVENHAGRPEVTAAAARRDGQRDPAQRHRRRRTSSTPLSPYGTERTGARRGARVALPLYGIEEQARDVARSVALALALAFAVAVVLAVALAAPLAGPAARDDGLRTPLRRRRPLRAHAHLAPGRDRRAGPHPRPLGGPAPGPAQRAGGERARTETILSAIDSGLLAVDHRGTVILANHSLRRSLDLPDPPRDGTTWRSSATPRWGGPWRPRSVRAGPRPWRSASTTCGASTPCRPVRSRDRRGCRTARC